MRWIWSLIRVSSLLAAVLVSMAIGLGKWQARLAGGHAGLHRIRSLQYSELTDFSPNQRPGCRLFNPDTGGSVWLRTEADDMLYYANTSPWEDENGESQVVGRWMRRVATGVAGKPGLSSGSGMARYLFPSGRVLDHVELDVVPSSFPCWYPGTSPRILFAGTDGRLYEYTFPHPGGGPRADGGDASSPRALRWACRGPGSGRIRIQDPFWPTDPRLSGKILVSLLSIDRTGHDASAAPARLWWLRLDREGTSVAEAGPLPVAAAGSEAEAEVRMPRLARRSGGGFTLAYLLRPADRLHWQLRISALGPEIASPPAAGPVPRSVVVADDLAPGSLGFSSDGRWIYGVRIHSDLSLEPRRFEVEEALGPRVPQRGNWDLSHSSEPTPAQPGRG